MYGFGKPIRLKFKAVSKLKILVIRPLHIHCIKAYLHRGKVEGKVEGKSEKDQRKLKNVKDKNNKHQRKFSLLFPISIGMNGPYG